MKEESGIIYKFKGERAYGNHYAMIGKNEVLLAPGNIYKIEKCQRDEFDNFYVTLN